MLGSVYACMLGNFFCMLFCRLLFFFSILTFSKTSFRNTINASNPLDPDQARHLSSLICIQIVGKYYQQMAFMNEEPSCLLLFFLNLLFIFKKIILRDTIKASSSLDPDQA